MISRFAILCLAIATTAAHAADLRVGTFNIDATPPVGSVLGGGSVPPMRGIDDPLSARGIVFIPGDQDPVAIVAVDWIGIANGGHYDWVHAIADACDTSPDRVMVHTLHQHDAPFYDSATEALMESVGLGGQMCDVEFSKAMIDRAATAAKEAFASAQPATHASWAEAKVEKVASNRRLVGEDGKVWGTRWTATTDPKLRAEPEGVIDPMMKSITFWNGDDAITTLTYYATHPQSFYRTGNVSADFPGLARNQREEATGIPHIHFNGAGGNITAGKYNDGNPKTRPVLVGRMADGMKRAFDTAEKKPIEDLDFSWTSVPTALPSRSETTVEGERAHLADEDLDKGQRARAAREIAWMTHHEEVPINIACLGLGPIRILHMPGELFIEYQLAAQEMAPEHFVCMAAYGDYGPGYIGTAVAYTEGGYEAQVYTSRVDPEVEDALMNAMRKALGEH